MSTNSVQQSGASLPHKPAPTRLRLAVGVATRGRPSVLADTLAELDQQSRRPDTIFVAYSAPGDIGNAKERFPHICFLASELGLTKQRNAILNALTDEEVILFLDDDFYLHTQYLTVTEQVFLREPQVAVATGTLLADGINGPGLSLMNAKAHLAMSELATDKHTLTQVFNAYGCNMSIRTKPIYQHRLRFDEKLPLYGWYEDVDFSRQLSFYGNIVQIKSAYGVHLGVKSGRQSGMRLGYSQVANPFYLAKKRSVSWLYAIASVSSRSIKNLLLSATPEPFVDRRGRLRGNIRALFDLFLGHLSPNRILDF